MPRVGQKKFPYSSQGILKAQQYGSMLPEGENKITEDTEDSLAKNNFEIFLQYSGSRFDWAKQVVENDAFRKRLEHLNIRFKGGK